MNQSASGKEKVPVIAQVRQMGAMFWIANGSEALERLAFFGVRAVLPLYMFGSDSVLHLSMTEKGVIFGIWALIQCLLPMISGGYTEAYGYRRSLVAAFSLNALGYLLMANIITLASDSHAGRFSLMLAAACLVGIGTAIFKPPVQGMVAKTLNEGNSSLGFGIFYWVVNIGGALAPTLAAMIRGTAENPTWENVFYGAAIVSAINLVFCLVFFAEPEKDASKARQNPVMVFAETMTQLWQDKAMFRFLLIISGFWLMFMQIWDLLPNFIDEWVDARDVGGVLTSLLGDGAKALLTADGALKPEMMININSYTIIIFVLPLTWFLGRYSMLFSLVLGMAIAMIGFLGAGLGHAGYLVALFIFIFSIGEIICSPKFSEYVGMSAPPDKKAQYMGYSNMPFAFGWFIGNIISGPLYDTFSSKTRLAKRYLIEELGMTGDELTAIGDKEIFPALAAKLGLDQYEAADVLWQAYHPWVIWLILGAVGLASLIGMVHMARNKSQRRP
ncbi:MAG: MFS transporter [Pirellulaceae bacterium]|nr:MFS transporter [Pirellulaceae bacterium]